MSEEKFRWRRALGILLLFGIAFGYLEGAVVTYLRSLYAPARKHFHPNPKPDELFPLLTLDQLRTAETDLHGTLYTEIAREAAKIADNERDGFAVFGVSLPHG